MSADSKFAGLTRENCATACNEQGCIMGAGRPRCFHPMKGALPLHLANDEELMRLRSQAC